MTIEDAMTRRTPGKIKVSNFLELFPALDGAPALKTLTHEGNRILKSVVEQDDHPIAEVRLRVKTKRGQEHYADDPERDANAAYLVWAWNNAENLYYASKRFDAVYGPDRTWSDMKTNANELHLAVAAAQSETPGAASLHAGKRKA